MRPAATGHYATVFADIPSASLMIRCGRAQCIKNPGAAQPREGAAASGADSGAASGTSSNQTAASGAAGNAPPGNGRAAGAFQVNQQIVERLDKIEQNLAEMNERLKKIELQQSRATP